MAFAARRTAMRLAASSFALQARGGHFGRAAATAYTRTPAARLSNDAGQNQLREAPIADERAFCLTARPSTN